MFVNKLKEIKATLLDETNSFVVIGPFGTSSPIRYSQCLEIKKAYPKGSTTIKYVGGEYGK